MGYVERKLDNVAWDTPGKKAQGRLLAVTQVKFQDGGRALRYKLKAGDGTIVIFPGATQLDQKLGVSDQGCNISVEYVGEDETRQMQHGKNRPKLFKVLVDESSREAQQVDDAPPITDEDIPF